MTTSSSRASSTAGHRCSARGACSYRATQRVTDEPAIAVVVQRWSTPTVGVMFTADPATGERSRLGDRGAFGLGEVVVGGAVEPDTYVVAKDGPALVETRVGRKAFRVVRGPDGHDLRVDHDPETAARARPGRRRGPRARAPRGCRSRPTTASPRTPNGRWRVTTSPSSSRVRSPHSWAGRPPGSAARGGRSSGGWVPRGHCRRASAVLRTPREGAALRPVRSSSRR